MEDFNFSLRDLKFQWNVPLTREPTFTWTFVPGISSGVATLDGSLFALTPFTEWARGNAPLHDNLTKLHSQQDFLQCHF